MRKFPLHLASSHRAASRALRTFALTMGLTVAPVFATTVRVDFNDLTSGTLQGQFGGTGFDEAEAWGNSNTLSVIGGDLLAPPSTNFAITQPGISQSAQGANGAAVQSSRGTDVPLSGTVWFSFLLHQPDSAARGGISFNNNTTTGAVIPRVIGVGPNVFIDYGDNSQDKWLYGVLTIGETALILGRIDLDSAGSVNDRLSLWIDPDVDAPGAPDVILEDNDAFDGAITRVAVTSYHSGGTIGGIVDLVSLADGPLAYHNVTGASDIEYLPTFADEFDQAALDTNAWTLDDERYNAEVTGGWLRLLTQADGDDFITGRIASDFTQRFGYFESRYRIGTDTGLNNAFWLSTPDDIAREPNGSPQDIDRMEVDINETHYPDELNVNLHDWSPEHIGISHARINTGLPLSQAFHTYAFDWRFDNTMNYYFDGALVHTATADEVNSIRSGLPMAVLFSTLVAPFAGTPGPNLDGTTMDVEYVRVYQRPGWSGAVSSDWFDADNWGADDIPGTNGAAVFNSDTPNPAVTLSSDAALREIYVEGVDTPAVTLGGSGTLTLGNVSSSDGIASITLNTDVTAGLAVDVPVVGIRDLIIANYSRQSAALVLNDTIDGLAPGRLLHMGGGDIAINGVIGDRIADVINFAGARTRLASANLYTGLTDIQGGALIVAADGALGATASGTQVASGAALMLADGVHYTQSEPLYLNGSGDPVASGALSVTDASNVTWNTNVWLTADASISSGDVGGSLTITGLVNSSDATSHELTLSGSGTVVLAGIVGPGIVDLRKTGVGSANLNASNNLFAGTTTIKLGELVLGANGTTGQSALIDVTTGGLFDVSAKPSGYSVAANRTLRADGTVVGDVTLQSGATLEGRGTLQGSVLVKNGATIRVGPDNIVNIQSVVVYPEADVRIRSGAPAINQGASNDLAIGPIASADIFRTLLRFSLASISPDAQIVGTPVLTLTGANADESSLSSTPNIEVRRLLNSFVESEATWNERSAGVPWNSMGGDLGILLVNKSGPDPDTFGNGEVIALSSSGMTSNLQNAVGAPDWSLILKTNSENSGDRSFYWVSSAEALKPPALSITYGERNTLGTLTFADGLELQDGATLTYEIGQPGDLIRISGGTFTGSGSDGVALEITNSDASTTGVYSLIDWQGAAATGVDVADFIVTPSIADAELRIVAEQLVLAILPDAERFDFDRDGDVDVADWAVFFSAMMGPTWPVPPAVTTEVLVRADSDGDGDVDLSDASAFQRALH